MQISCSGYLCAAPTPFILVKERSVSYIKTKFGTIILWLPGIRLWEIVSGSFYAFVPDVSDSAQLVFPVFDCFCFDVRSFSLIGRLKHVHSEALCLV